MKKKQFVIFDKDVVYATRLERFLCEREGSLFEILSFSVKEKLEEVYGKAKQIKPEILLVAESCYYEGISKVGAKHIFILNETGLKCLSQYANFSKYQPANMLFQQIMLEYADKEKEFIPRFCKGKQAKIIGVYTPITRCLQTGFSFSLAQSLGNKGRTLYINFEQYSGFSKMFQRGYIKDLSDLAYYFSYSRDKFLYWLEGVTEHFKNADYIPPVLTAVSVSEISKDVWLGMLERISMDAEYDYIVLDLSENVQGIFQILELCHIVYTITREDIVSAAKLYQFGEILKEDKFASLRGKIRYISFPGFCFTDMNMEEILHGELQQYTSELVEEIFYEQKTL